MRCFFSLLFLFTCSISFGQNNNNNLSYHNDVSSNSYVNPFIGTGGHGHTYPGATAPFGMIQLSPDTRLDGWDGCSGYHYSDEYIYGFSHTHLSGTGVSDYGDILLMPTNAPTLNNGSDGKKGYRAHFSHLNESAQPGFYKVLLDSTNINVELTVSKRSGIHKYKFENAKSQYVILDLLHRDELLEGRIHMVSDTEISGFRNSKAWASDQKLFYYIKFSHPISMEAQFSENNSDIIKAAFHVENPDNEPVFVKVGISAVDEFGAKQNMQTEIGDRSFEDIKQEIQNSWQQQLQKIDIKSNNETNKVIFYSALYHTMIAPNLYQDVDGRYRGMDLKIHQTKEFEYYTVFSLWDTYRAAHPLYTILEPTRTNDFINTFLAKYEEGGIMPIWDLSGNYTGCMIGYHAVPVIADAFLKGIKSFDIEKAFRAMKHSANQDQLGLKSYKNLGFIPVEEESESVSKTLEYAYDDWTIAQMAKALGKKEDYENFIKRAQNYKNVFDPDSQFMRGRSKNKWFAPFDPYEVNFNYTEANSWQYSFYVPQDISGLTTLIGGKKKLEAHLDDLFTAEAQTSGRDQADITGLIGQYAHGNEPSHHMAYLYNFVNKPHKTQEKVHQILTELYKNDPDGISGNEDCGQMSAWYVFSALGFYPVTPGSNDYIIGTPLFEEATINLESGKQFHIKAINLSESNKYIDHVNLNGKPLNQSYLKHQDIINGGEMEFFMTNTASNWGTIDGEEPITIITEFNIVPVPYIAKGDVAFKIQTEITLENVDKNASIFYNLSDKGFNLYKEPFTIESPVSLKIYSILKDVKSAIVETNFYKIDPNISLTLKSEYANQYNGGGDQALIDGLKGTTDFRTGSWQGYLNRDVIAVIDLGSIKSVNDLKINFLQDQHSWIFYPKEVACYISDDAENNFKLISNQKIDASEPSSLLDIKTFNFNLKGNKGRYLKVVAKKLGILPEWHIGYSKNSFSWMFVDEITVE